MSSRLVEYPAKRHLCDHDPVARSGDGLLHYGNLTPALSELLDVRFHRFADREAVVEPDGARLTYRELWGVASRIAGGLQDHGIGVGDRVGIRFPNGVRWVEAFFGVLASGAVPVPVNDVLGVAAVRHILDDSDVDFVLDSELPDGRPFIDDGAGLGELAVLCYTNGSRGAPKGVELSNENLLSAIESVIGALRLGWDGFRNLVTLPLAHASGCVDQMLPTLAAGGTVVLGTGPDPEGLARAIDAERVDMVAAHPALLDAAATYLRDARFGTQPVRRICCTGTALTPEQSRALRSAFPAASQSSFWGTTETSGIALALDDDAMIEHGGTVGIPFGGTELALSGPDAASGCGELLCRGPNVTRGYWKDPQATMRQFTGQWFHTGDQVEIDTDGFVRMTTQSVEPSLAESGQHA